MGLDDALFEVYGDPDDVSYCRACEEPFEHGEQVALVVLYSTAGEPKGAWAYHPDHLSEEGRLRYLQERSRQQADLN